ncbi:hypothetical protein V6N13_021256 [Hibiscus sabdariffa]
MTNNQFPWIRTNEAASNCRKTRLAPPHFTAARLIRFRKEPTCLTNWRPFSRPLTGWNSSCWTSSSGASSREFTLSCVSHIEVDGWSYAGVG